MLSELRQKRDIDVPTYVLRHRHSSLFIRVRDNCTKPLMSVWEEQHVAAFTLDLDYPIFTSSKMSELAGILCPSGPRLEKQLRDPGLIDLIRKDVEILRLNDVKSNIQEIGNKLTGSLEIDFEVLRRPEYVKGKAFDQRDMPDVLVRKYFGVDPSKRTEFKAAKFVTVEFENESDCNESCGRYLAMDGYNSEFGLIEMLIDLPESYPLINQYSRYADNRTYKVAMLNMTETRYEFEPESETSLTM